MPAKQASVADGDNTYTAVRLGFGTRGYCLLGLAVTFLLGSGLAAGLQPNSPPDEVKSPTVGLTFKLIHSQKFSMGSRWNEAELQRRFGSTGGQNEQPVHEVELDAYYIATTEVTVGQWRKFAAETKYKTLAQRKGSKQTWFSPGFKQSDKNPVTLVNWDDAVAFAKWLSEKDGVRYRLPTEAEWECACRANADSEFWWGDEEGAEFRSCNLFSTRDAFEYAAPVASLKPNPWGLYDMMGNVWEWCSDWYQSDYYRVSPPKNPKGPDHGEQKVQKGGSFYDPISGARPGGRHHQPPESYYHNVGFRLVREVR